MASERITCLCGEIVLEVSGAPLAQLYCHCRACQAVHSAAYVPSMLYRSEQVRLVQGKPSEYTFRTTPRWTCPVCGSRVLAMSSPQLRGIMAALFPSGRFRPTMHINCESALLPVRDSLPHYRTVPAAFGGSDETVDW